MEVNAGPVQSAGDVTGTDVTGVTGEVTGTVVTGEVTGTDVTGEVHVDVDDEAGAAPAAPGQPPTVAPAPASAVAPVPPRPPVPRPGRQFRLVTVVSVTVALPDQFPTVVIEDLEEHHRQLSFRIGMAEGAAIASALEQRIMPRPLTHDLFAETLERFSIDVLAVRVTGRVGTTYLAELDLTGPHGREVLSCRPSDGICLALRRQVSAPILADERLFLEVGDVIPDAATTATSSGPPD